METIERNKYNSRGILLVEDKMTSSKRLRRAVIRPLIMCAEVLTDMNIQVSDTTASLEDIWSRRGGAIGVQPYPHMRLYLMQARLLLFSSKSFYFTAIFLV